MSWYRNASKAGTAPVLFGSRNARPGLRTSSYTVVSARKIPIVLSSSRKTSIGRRYNAVTFPTFLSRLGGGRVQPDAQHEQTPLRRKNFPTAILSRNDSHFRLPR